MRNELKVIVDSRLINRILKGIIKYRFIETIRMNKN